ncbi:MULTISPECIES: UDP-N-acetylmuramoyl-L-alanyl-D-glutamate--2,6-diaminopimelate ligase [unclassified Ruminococcus]|uniref:UDP-N-acetylmuramoyl-L-alanyl-D-glutamate--2, 6-diaminopimelate ligase n=1 Tax=unclassified Ruminococcus TaxID=2608920 RepID=UPI00210E7767|nr:MULTISPECIES: UDP-N-acetylmuramoyl-L-alanyl-D-glutamate--2,6-diaminopimelate ligase [unclassified Ruminococcus]MCQ4021925.1 UDP-N-acetylmuramoyl-L-alanyl-D-glutamate--2,6-diaminopimelate ligase [Ruminococcus sp. zg-924]MCQ4115661.1 UDP-N-acetylmuramoyl-L-alanyl-D-glutamate--2,6-diaminopimelate ligase [Ruminococcus sp. zg-921]
MKLSRLLEKLTYNLVQGDENTDITTLVYDSRKAEKGSVFVCLKGYNSDGHAFAPKAIEQGAAVLIVEDDIKAPQNVTIIKVEDTRKALAFMSAAYFDYPAAKLKTIAITGTKGKTTTVSMIRSILEAGGIKTGTIGTVGIVIGDKIFKTNNTTPESFEIQQALNNMVDAGCGCMVIEASSLGLKWHRTDAIDFDYGIFTNFSDDHIGGAEHKDLEEYMYCKSLLFKQCKLGLINIDDKSYKGIIDGHTCDIETYGFNNDNADISAYGDELISKPGYLGVHFKTKGKLEIAVDVPIPGRFSVYNGLSALSVCRHFGIDKETMIKGLDRAYVKGRVESVPVPGNYTLLIDYAHNAVSMENVLTTLREYKPNRLITMFGAGGNRPKVRRYEMGEISGKLSDLSVITTDNPRFEEPMDIINDIKTGIDKTDGKYIIVPDRRDAIRWCIENAQDGDIIVLAGKGHEDYQEIKGVKHHLDEREVIADILSESKN